MLRFYLGFCRAAGWGWLPHRAAHVLWRFGVWGCARHGMHGL